MQLRYDLNASPKTIQSSQTFANTHTNTYDTLRLNMERGLRAAYTLVYVCGGLHCVYLLFVRLLFTFDERIYMHFSCESFTNERNEKEKLLWKPHSTNNSSSDIA